MLLMFLCGFLSSCTACLCICQFGVDNCDFQNVFSAIWHWIVSFSFFSHNKQYCEQVCPRIMCVYRKPLHSPWALSVFSIGECRCVGCSSILLIRAHTLDDKVSTTQLVYISHKKTREDMATYWKHLNCHQHKHKYLSSCLYNCLLRQNDFSTMKNATVSVNGQPQ